MDLSNKNIILTGASSGIGKELLNRLSEYEDTKIIAVARNITTIPKNEGIIFPFAADLSEQREIDRLFDFAKDLFTTIDIFIANAGYAYIEELNNADWKHIESIFTVNTTGVIYSLLKFNSQQINKTKQFICTISAVAHIPLYGYALYCSSKAALHQFFDSYRQEENDNLIITTVYPIATKTPFFDHASGLNQTPSPWPAQNVESVVNKIIRGIEKDKKKVYPSIIFNIFYPMGRTFPFLLKLYSTIEKKKTKHWLRS